MTPLEKLVTLGAPLVGNLSECPKLIGSTILAWGYYRDDITVYLVMLAPNKRVPNEENYATLYMNLRPLTDPDNANIFYGDYTERRAMVPYGVQTFPNIVPTVQCWQDEYGMDY